MIREFLFHILSKCSSLRSFCATRAALQLGRGLQLLVLVLDTNTAIPTTVFIISTVLINFNISPNITPNISLLSNCSYHHSGYFDCHPFCHRHWRPAPWSLQSNALTATMVYLGVILGLYWDNGKENGNYCIIIGYILGLSRVSG